MRTTSVFRPFECEAIFSLCRADLTRDDLEAVLNEAELVDLDHTGVGYVLTVRHPRLPEERTVYSGPLLMGRGCDTEVGFVVFIEEGELTLECHSWSGDAVPESIRDLPLVVTDVEPSEPPG